MNHYQFEDIYVGLKEEFQVTVSEEMLTQLCSITKDVNPLHTDETFAKEKGYDGMVSIEVFRPEYWKMKPEDLIPLAYETTRKVLKENECL